MGKNDTISRSVIKRLPRYYSYLEELDKQGVMRISSGELAKKMKLTASQIRQDLNNFGGFGQQGYGYNVAELHAQIAHILGADRSFTVVLIGVGNIGKALATQVNFNKRGCKLIGLFDNDKDVIGDEINGIKVQNVESLGEFCDKNKPSIAVLCVPKTAAEGVAQTLIEHNVTSFWNFSHYDLNVRFDGITVENVHLGDSLMSLVFMTMNK